jgi:hypothetical protein
VNPAFTHAIARKENNKGVCPRKKDTRNKGRKHQAKLATRTTTINEWARKRYLITARYKEADYLIQRCHFPGSSFVRPRGYYITNTTVMETHNQAHSIAL